MPPFFFPEKIINAEELATEQRVPKAAGKAQPWGVGSGSGKSGGALGLASVGLGAAWPIPGDWSGNRSRDPWWAAFSQELANRWELLGRIFAGSLIAMGIPRV